MFSIDLNDQIQFEYRNEYSLLDTIEKHDPNINYSCRGGFCGACRVKVEKGTVIHHIEPMLDCAKDEVLSCCCTPSSDLKISY